MANVPLSRGVLVSGNLAALVLSSLSNTLTVDKVTNLSLNAAHNLVKPVGWGHFALDLYLKNGDASGARAEVADAPATF